MPSPQPSVQEAARAWLQLRHGGRWTADDEHRLAAWLAEAPDHAQAWAEAQALWHSLEGVRALAQPALQRARRASRPIALWRRAALPAGGLALALAVVLTLRTLPGAFDDAQVVQASQGEMRSLTLPDGSRIDLNTGSRVKLSTSLLCRCVELQAGEAAFTVAHGDPRPFRVEAGAATIVDVGTVFWARREPSGVAVAVSEGEVDVFQPGQTEPTRLGTGQQLALDARGQPKATTAREVADLTAWRQGEIVFHDAPLGEVLAEFSRYHPVRFEMDARLSAYRLSGRLASGDLDKLLVLLQAGYPALAVRVAPDLIRLNFRGA